MCVYVCMRHSSFKPFWLIVHCWLMATFQEPSRNVRVSILICIICFPFSATHSVSEVGKLPMSVFASFCPLLQLFQMCIVGELKSNIFSFLWPKLSSLFLLLCVFLADHYRGRNTMTVFSPTPPPLPPVFSLSVSKREVYSTAAMLMRISFCLNSLPVRGIRTDTHKCQTYFTLTRSRAFVCVHVCELWLVFISML